jgi:hypothetical protein
MARTSLGRASADAVSEIRLVGVGASVRPAPCQSKRSNAQEAPAPPPPGQEPAVQVRSDFRSTILWQPDIGRWNGNATVKVKYPDSLTTWSATARVVTAANQFGIGDTSTRTKQP